MRTSELVSRLPGGVRSELEKEAGRIHGMTGELAEALSKPELLAAKLASMRHVERRTLETVVRKFAHLPFGTEELQTAAASAGLSGAEARVGLILLQRSGVVYELRKAWGESLYMLPEDTFSVWQRLLFPFPSSVCRLDRSGAAEALGGERGSLLHDVFRLVADISRENVPLTRKGAIHKKQVQRLSSLLGIKDADVEPLGLAYPQRDTFGPALALVLDMALRLTLIRPVGQALRADEANFAAWTRKPLSFIRHSLYSLLRRVTARNEAWHIHLMAAIEQAEPGVWHMLETFFDWLAGCAMIESAQAEDAMSFCANRLLPLQAMGWLETGLTADGKPVFRWRDDFHPPETTDKWRQPDPKSVTEAKPLLYVQSDFEIVVPPDVPLYVLRSLERMAERLRTDEVWVYRLTKGSLGRTLEEGMTAEECLRVLETNARYGVPGNVSEAVRDWAAGYERVTFAEAVIMRCKDKATADWLAELPEVRPFLPERIGDTVFLVLREKLETLILLISGFGFSPRTTAEPATERVGRTEQVPAACGGDAPGMPGCILYEPDGVSLYPIAARLPLPEEALPGVRTIPSMWWKECRAYHASTQKEIARKAIEWRACLRLKRKDVCWDVVPARLLESRAGWSLTGTIGSEPISLQAGDWQEMQILLPDWEALKL